MRRQGRERPGRQKTRSARIWWADLTSRRGPERPRRDPRAGVDAREIDPFLDRMRPLPARSEHDRGDAGRLDEGGVHPVALAVELGRPARHRLGRPRDRLDHVGARLHAERVAHEAEPRLGALDPRGQGLALAPHVVRRLPGDGAALEREDAAGGIARELLAALDQRGMHGAGPDELVPRRCIERRLELRKAGECRRHSRDRVNALGGARAVCRAPARLDLGPDEALVRDADAQRSGLGDDCGIGAPAPKHGLHHDAGILLVRDRGHDHVARKLIRTQSLRRQHAGRQPRLHVVGAATVQPPVPHDGLEWPLHARHAHRVHVCVQHQRAAASSPSGDPDHARPARCRLVDLHLEAGVAEPGAHEGGHLGLPRPA
jgi:hypothetical protein